MIHPNPDDGQVMAAQRLRLTMALYHSRRSAPPLHHVSSRRTSRTIVAKPVALLVSVGRRVDRYPEPEEAMR